MPRTLRFLGLAVLGALLALTAPLIGAEPIDSSTAKDDGKVLWYDIRPLGVEGQGWKEVTSPYDRLPPTPL